MLLALTIKNKYFDDKFSLPYSKIIKELTIVLRHAGIAVLGASRTEILIVGQELSEAQQADIIEKLQQRLVYIAAQDNAKTLFLISLNTLTEAFCPMLDRRWQVVRLEADGGFLTDHFYLTASAGVSLQAFAAALEQVIDPGLISLDDDEDNEQTLLIKGIHSLNLQKFSVPQKIIDQMTAAPADTVEEQVVPAGTLQFPSQKEKVLKVEQVTTNPIPAVSAVSAKLITSTSPIFSGLTERQHEKLIPLRAPYLPANRFFLYVPPEIKDSFATEEEYRHFVNIAERGNIVSRKGAEGIVPTRHVMTDKFGKAFPVNFKIKSLGDTGDIRIYIRTVEKVRGAEKDAPEQTLLIGDRVICHSHRIY